MDRAKSFRRALSVHLERDWELPHRQSIGLHLDALPFLSTLISSPDRYKHLSEIDMAIQLATVPMLARVNCILLPAEREMLMLVVNDHRVLVSVNRQLVRPYSTDHRAAMMLYAAHQFPDKVPSDPVDVCLDAIDRHLKLHGDTIRATFPNQKGLLDLAGHGMNQMQIGSQDTNRTIN